MTNDLSHFHDDLCAAISGRVPISFHSSLFSGRASIRSVRALETATVTPLRYDAAVEVLSVSGSIQHVIEGLSVDQRARLQLVRIVRTPLIYLLAIVLVASFGMHFFSNSITPSFLSIRADLKLPLVIDAPQRSLHREWIDGFASLFGFIALAGFAMLMFGGARIAVMILGGWRYHQCQLACVAIRIAQILIANGVDFQNALRLGLATVGANEKSSRWLTAQFTQSPFTTSTLDGLYDYFQGIARNRLASLRIAIPLLLVSVLGGVIVTGYCLAIFSPIAFLIQDLSLPGIQ